jgi:hypothetical protein
MQDLKDLLRDASGPTPASRALYVLAGGHRLGLKPAVVRTFVTRCSDKPLAALASTRVWPLLSRDALKAVEASNSPRGRANTRREISRALVAAALTPAIIPLDEAGQPVLNAVRVVAARAACVIAGLPFLEGATTSGFRGGRIGEEDLAVSLGVSRPAARRALQAAEALGWFRCTSRRKGGASRYVFALPLPAVTAEAVAEHLELFALLGNPDLMAQAIKADDAMDPDLRIELAPATDVTRALRILLSAPHAAWSYGAAKGDGSHVRDGVALPALDHRDWLVLFADAAGADAVALGMTERSVRASRRDLKAAGIGAAYPGTLDEQLHSYAARSGARPRHDEAWARRNDARRARAVQVQAHQAEKRTRLTYGPIQAAIVVNRLTPLPAPGSDGAPTAEFWTWLAGAQVEMRHVRSGAGNGRSGRSWSGSEVPILAELTARATAAGYGYPDSLAAAVLVVSDATRAADFILAEPLPAAIGGRPESAFATWLVAARTEVLEAREHWTGSEAPLVAELTLRASEAGYDEPAKITAGILWAAAA